MTTHLMNTQELFNWLQHKPENATLVDVREYTELKEQGVIKGYNQNIPWFLTNTDPDLFDQKFSTINKDEQLVIVCRSGRRSGFATDYLVSKLGFKNVYDVEGGVLDWVKQGYPVDTVA